MTPSLAPPPRKRGRPRNESNEDAPNKRPRLTSPSTTAKATSGSSQPVPSTASNSSVRKAERIVSTNGRPLKKGRAPINIALEIPESDDEGQKTGTKKANVISKLPVKQENGDIDGVYNFCGSDEESGPTQSPSRKAAKGAAAATKGRPSLAPKFSASSKKSVSKTVSKPPSQVTGRGATSAPTGTRSKKAGQDSGTFDEEEDSADEVNNSDDVLNTPSAAVRSSKRGAPLAKANGATPKLRGILTPSRRLSERNSKSVAFDEPSKKTEEVFFADLPSKAVKPKAASQRRPVGKENIPAEALHEPESDTLEEDDEVCTICSKPESKPPNQILFCDSCDMAVHQKCYGVARIPKGDWLCKDCSRDSAAVITEVKTSVVASGEVPIIPNFEQHLRSLQRILLDRCTGKRRIKLRGQDDAYEKTYQLVEQTVMAGEGNSMLIIGARGCGKTIMVDSVLSDVGLEHRNDFHVVRLNGFIHTDDKLALKDIWRQLGKEMQVEDDLIGKTNNYADTLASLLALLSHPSEIADAQEGVTSKSVVFIIDEFDLFATHARQTLLYNLFDICQSRKAPIAVLGLTNRIDVVESLEKRVKSRFSHRYVYMSLPKTFREYWEICRQGLIVDDEDAKAEGLDISLKGFGEFADFWTKKIETLYKDQAFKDHIEYYYYSSKSATAFLSGCVLPLANLSPPDMVIRLSSTQCMTFSTDPPDSKLHLLEALSDLDLSLLISAARLDIIAHTDTVNFAMAYDEYTTLIGRQRVQSSTSGMLALGGGVRVWGRGVAEMAWERLVGVGLLLPTGMGSKHGGLEGRMWKVDVTLEEIPVAVKLNTVLARWCKEI